jgi:4-hydroxythreonine-4-phosphate dehydrogenase
MKPLIGVTMGDPAGIGPEIALRAAERSDTAVLLLGDPELLIGRAGELPGPRTPERVDSAAGARERLIGGAPGPWVLEVTSVEPGLTPGAPRTADGRAALDCILAGAALAEAGEIDALVTAPVSKELIARHEPRFLGHTELLAERVGREPIMLFAGIRPHVALLTTHLPTTTALTLIRTGTVARMLRRLHQEWSVTFGRAPHIGVAALNPHAGEGGRLGSEESRVLAPAIAAARAAGVSAHGPYPADSVFLHEELDVVLALYHDQGTIIAKRAPTPSVNLTLGLPYVRTSPDHGTAYDRAAGGDVDAEPMTVAVTLAAELAERARG